MLAKYTRETTDRIRNVLGLRADPSNLTSSINLKEWRKENQLGMMYNKYYQESLLIFIIFVWQPDQMQYEK